MEEVDRLLLSIVSKIQAHREERELLKEYAALCSVGREQAGVLEVLCIGRLTSF